MRIPTIMVSAFLSCLLSVAAFAQESEIQILDASGTPRGASMVNGLSRVDFKVVDASGNSVEDAVVTLTNASGETITASSKLGIATFDNIAPGVWTVSCSTPGVVIADASILAVSAAGIGGLTGGAVLLTGGVATGAGLGIQQAASKSNSGSNPISPAS
ncbi:MAG: carboxypeptidase regulatory-like domain-containing protein [Proteobacteria bacterium]|nr:carboxypeptidase regulatory-like domain-containing protein [Pseudomonadota bacterium]